MKIECRVYSFCALDHFPIVSTDRFESISHVSSVWKEVDFVWNHQRNALSHTEETWIQLKLDREGVEFHRPGLFGT